MADKKISQLTGATTPVAGTEVLPIVQGGSTVKVSIDNVTAGRAVNGLSFTATKTGNDAFIKVQNSGAGAAGAWVFVDSVDPAYRGMVVQSGGVENWVIGGYGTSELQVIRGSRGAGTEVFRYLGTNDVKVSAGNLVIGTAAKGIDFSANTHAAGMTSELLDWYEEGTFTPTLQGSTGNPTPTYTAQVGTYTRIGNIVYVWIQVYTSAVSGGTGDLRIGDLPFSTNASYGARFIVTCTRVDFSATATYVNAAVDGSSNKIYLTETNDNSNDTVVPISAWNAGAAAGVSISGFYFV